MIIQIPNKKCCVCNEIKILDDFYKNKRSSDGFNYCCKKCFLKRFKKYRIKNKDIILSKMRDKYYKDKDTILSRNKKWRDNNPDKIREIKKKEYLKNKDKYSKRRKIYENNKLKTDPYFKFMHQLRCRLRIAIKNKYKSGSAVNDIGCSSKEAYDYISSKFKDGMSWENYGKWHIDHIKPLSSFNLENREEFLKAVNYTNLQPLWAKDNLSKGNRI